MLSNNEDFLLIYTKQIIFNIVKSRFLRMDIWLRVD